MVYNMYMPIAEDDNTTICALMKLYRTYYRVIGLVKITFRKLVKCIKLTSFDVTLVQYCEVFGIAPKQKKEKGQ